MQEQKTSPLTVRRVLGCVLGVVVIGLGAALFKQSHLGNDPFNAMNMTLSGVTGLPLGAQTIATNLVFLVIQLIWGRRYIGIGTIVNGLGLGYIISFFYDRFLTPFGAPETLPQQLLWLAIGLPILAFGCSLYQTADLGVAPYDYLALGMDEHLSAVPYFLCRISTDAVCTLVALAFGGLVGLGTAITVFGLGTFIQLFNSASIRLIGHDPRK